MALAGNLNSSASNKASAKMRLFLLRVAAVITIFACLKMGFDQLALLQTEQGLLLTRKIRKGTTGISSDNFKGPVMTLDNLSDLRNSTPTPRTDGPEYWGDSIERRRPVIEILEKAGVKMDLDLVLRLPQWSDVKELYGDKAIILGMDRCQEYRRGTTARNRAAAIAGQFNTGTNVMAQYFFQNLAMPDNPTRRAFLANVPWHKHGWVDLRNQHFFTEPKNHSSVLPVVIVRDPYFWLQSMCQSPYLLQWKHSAVHCPNLLDETRTSVPVKLVLGKHMQFKKTWDSLIHVWSEWYGEYFDANFPRLMIRFEDVLFHTEEVMDSIRKCTGGVWKSETFKYQTASSKAGKKYFDDIKPQSSMISAIIKYGQDDTGRRIRNMTYHDLKFARRHLDERLLEAFHYIHPDHL